MGELSFDELERKIGLTIANRELLTEAFTHGSIRGSPQNKDSGTFRRLEFLGDAVIRLAVSASVYEESNGNVEMLHDRREKLIPNRSLTHATKELCLSKYLRWSGSQDVVNSPLIPAKLYEALTGVIFLDKGYEAASKFVEETLILPNSKTTR